MVEGGFSVGEIERVANDFFNGNKIIFNIITRKKIFDIVLFLNISILITTCLAIYIVSVLSVRYQKLLEI